MKITAEKLKELVCSVFTSVGISSDEADIVSSSLVESNLAGHDSHGVIRLPRYVQAIRKGDINIRAKIRIVKQNSGNFVIDGNWGFGQVIAKKTMEMAIKKAEEQGVGCATIFNCNDVGRLGTYTTIATDHNFIGVMTVNDGGANPCVAPWGGKSPLFSTNPISVAIPTGKKNAICVDMATSVVAAGKIALARQRGEQLPEGWVINASGKPSTNSQDFYGPPHGALLPLGGLVSGHKGFGLSLIVDILSGALSEAGCSGSGGRDSQGIFMLAINISAFVPFEEFTERVTRLIETIKSSPKAEGVKEILIPGEPECREKEKRIKEGIFIEDTTWKEILEIARELGLERKWK